MRKGYYNIGYKIGQGYKRLHQYTQARFERKGYSKKVANLFFISSQIMTALLLVALVPFAYIAGFLCLIVGVLLVIQHFTSPPVAYQNNHYKFWNVFYDDDDDCGMFCDSSGNSMDSLAYDDD